MGKKARMRRYPQKYGRKFAVHPAFKARHDVEKELEVGVVLEEPKVELPEPKEEPKKEGCGDCGGCKDCEEKKEPKVEAPEPKVEVPVEKVVVEKPKAKPKAKPKTTRKRTTRKKAAPKKTSKE